MVGKITYTEREGKILKEMGYSKKEIKNILKLRKLLKGVRNANKKEN